MLNLVIILVVLGVVAYVVSIAPIIEGTAKQVIIWLIIAIMCFVVIKALFPGVLAGL